MEKNIEVNILPTLESFTLHVTTNTTIKALKEMIQTRINIPPHLQVLMYKGTILNDTIVATTRLIGTSMPTLMTLGLANESKINIDLKILQDTITFFNQMTIQKTKYYNELYLDRETYGDISIELPNGKIIKAHGVIVSENQFFRESIKKSNKVKIPVNVTEQALNSLIGYFYNHVIPDEIISNNVLHEIYTLSHSLDIPHFVNYTKQLMTTTMTPQSILNYISVLDERDQLYNQCWDYMKTNYHTIIKTETLVKCPEVVLNRVLNERIRTNSQMLFENVKKWIEHNKTCEEKAKSILSKLDYKAMHPAYFTTRVIPFITKTSIPLFENNTNLDDILDYLCNKKCEWDVLHDCIIVKNRKDVLSISESLSKIKKNNPWAYSSMLYSKNNLISLVFFDSKPSKEEEENEIDISFLNDSLDKGLQHDDNYENGGYCTLKSCKVKEKTSILIQMNKKNIEYYRNGEKIKEIDNTLEDYVRLHVKIKGCVMKIAIQQMYNEERLDDNEDEGQLKKSKSEFKKDKDESKEEKGEPKEKKSELKIGKDEPKESNSKLKEDTDELKEEEKKEKPIDEKKEGLLFVLDKSTIRGDNITLQEDGLTVIKSKTSHCAISSLKGFNTGVHKWNVTFLPKESMCGEFWLMVGIHTNPSNMKTHPSWDNGVYGLSVSNNLNGWTIKAGETVYGQRERQIFPNETIQVVLDCDNSKITFIHPKWTASIDNLPKQDLYPYFDPYDLSFKLETDPKTIKSIISSSISSQSNDISSKFALDRSTIKGPITLQEDGLTVIKTSTSHCAISSLKAFNAGVHKWNVTFLARESWSVEFWLMVGVHIDPSNMKSHPTGDPGVYGLSVSNNLNGWITQAGKTVYQKERQIFPNETIQVVLDCDNSKITFIHPKWTASIDNLPKQNLYPYFDPYDLSFKLETDPNTIKSIINPILSRQPSNKPPQFVLDRSTIKGTSLTLQEDGLTVVKSITNHCAISSLKAFNTGVHKWNVTFLARESWSGEFWLMVGVHTDSSNMKPHPSGDPGVYGLSVSNNLNGWTTRAGVTVFGQKERQIFLNETIQVVLDCDNSKITFIHPKWTASIDSLPKQNLYPYFDPYDLSFKLEPDPNSKFVLDRPTIKGSIILQDDGLTVLKTSTYHCAISSLQSFNTGIHKWNVTFLQRETWSGEFWLMAGVHTNPSNMKTYPTGDPGVYGLSVSNNLNGWTTRAGTTVFGQKERQIFPNETIQVVLDCDNSNITFIHPKWTASIDNLPKQNLYPYFDPYDLSFKLETDPNTMKSIINPILSSQPSNNPPKFVLDRCTIKGTSLTLQEDGLTVVKSITNHCAISSLKAFNAGVHKWNVTFLAKESWSGEFWLMVGVHTDSSNMKTYPTGDPGVYRLSVSNNLNGWTTRAGTTVTGQRERQIFPNETIQVVLDCDNSKITFIHSKWTASIDSLPKQNLYPYFDPYDLSFKISF